MGKLIDGKWVESSIVSRNTDGGYERVQRGFLDTISPSHPRFKPESGRYHLYVSYACPWAHRTLIYRQLKSLESHISVSVVHPDMLEHGWTFDTDFSGCTGDSLYNHTNLYQLYQTADPTASTTVTVPVLWDKKEQTIVNNESSQIIRIFNTAFNDITGNTDDFYPEHWRDRIDAFNTMIYEPVNNGVYKCGFAQTQRAYDEAVSTLFNTLDALDDCLASQPYLVGEFLTEADLRLIPTLLRFDPVYVTHFKCTLKRIMDYPNLSRYLDRMKRHPAIYDTTHWDHIKRHYFYSHDFINPYRIIPLGPEGY
ncbi:MAG: glutathione S-transferase family protein [Candidatus Marinamargulisbacteria bacterium]